MRRELQGPQPHPVERAQHVNVAVEIEAPLQVEKRCDLAAARDPFDIGGIERKLDRLSNQDATSGAGPPAMSDES